MKILGVSCSPRKKGNTVILMEETLRGAAEHGANTELFSVSGKDIRGCDGCYSCLANFTALCSSISCNLANSALSCASICPSSAVI